MATPTSACCGWSSGAWSVAVVLMRMGTWLQHVTPARERRARRAVAPRQPLDPRRAGRGVARRARREAAGRLPVAHRRPVRPGGGAGDGGRPGRVPAHRGSRHAHRLRVRRLPGCRHGGAAEGRRSAAAPVVRVRDRLPAGRVRRPLGLVAAPPPGAGHDVRAVRGGLRRVPLPRRVRPRQRRRLARADPPPWLQRACPTHGLVETLYDEDANILRYLEQWQAPTKVHVPDRGELPADAGGVRLRAAGLPHPAHLHPDPGRHRALQPEVPHLLHRLRPRAHRGGAAGRHPRQRRRPALPGGGPSGRPDAVGGEPTLYPDWPSCWTNSSPARSCGSW